MFESELLRLLRSKNKTQLSQPDTFKIKQASSGHEIGRWCAVNSDLASELRQAF
jgi:hypothetical protein